MVVVAIHGGPSPLEPDPDIIEDLTRLMTLAVSGQMKSFAYCYTAADGLRSTGWTGRAGSRADLAMGIGILNHRYFQALVDDREPVPPKEL